MIKKEKLYREKIQKFNEERYFQMIPVSRLHNMDDPILDPTYKMDLMEEEISDNGVLSPLTVAERQDGTYLIIDGVRRANAFRSLLKDEEIPCYVVKDKETPIRELRLLSLAANRVKRPENADISIRYTQELLRLHGKGIFTKADLPSAYSQLTGNTPRQGRKYLNIVENGSEKVVNEVKEGRLPVNTANKIVERPEKEQDKIVKEYQRLPHGEKKIFEKMIKESSHPTAKAAHKAKIKENVTAASNSLKFLLSEDTKLNKKEIQFLLSLCSAFVMKYGSELLPAALSESK